MIWDLLDEDCVGIGDWVDADTGVAVSEVDPAGQFRFDTNLGAAGDAIAYRHRAIASPPDKFIIEIRLYCDDIGTNVNKDYFQLTYMTGTWQLRVHFCSDGLFIRDDVGLVELGINLVSEGAWQTWRFEVDKSGGEGLATVEVFIDNISQGTADCNFEVAGVDGKIIVLQRGETTNNMVSHSDWIKIGEVSLNPLFFGCNF